MAAVDTGRLDKVIVVIHCKWRRWSAENEAES
jgi:hypothetical protein